MANHVLFVSPYLTKGSNAQQQYDAAMSQAIGRARRFGQEKRVHIYQYVTSKTIDVDIIEKRSSRVLKRVKGLVQNNPPYDEFEAPRVALVEITGDADSQSDFASSAVGEIFPLGSEYA